MQHTEITAAPIDEYVSCVGWVVLTTITDNDGRPTYKHSSIYRRMEDAQRIAAVVPPLKLWERKIERTVQPCCTAFPLADVLSGNATRWNDWLDEGELARPAHYSLGAAA